jgi:hypothetical protein
VVAAAETSGWMPRRRRWVVAATETLGGRRDGDVGRGSRPRRWAIAATKTSDNCFAGNAHFRVPAKNISIDVNRTAQ